VKCIKILYLFEKNDLPLFGGLILIFDFYEE